MTTPAGFVNLEVERMKYQHESRKWVHSKNMNAKSNRKNDAILEEEILKKLTKDLALETWQLVFLFIGVHVYKIVML